MDTSENLEAGAASEKVDVAALINTIKRNMPEVYTMIKAKAAEIGNDAYGHVRAGLAGKANRFYAFERGHLVGTPFNMPGITADVARFMVEFGLNACAIWAPVQSPARGSEVANAD
jgi:hypothetical protein